MRLSSLYIDLQHFSDKVSANQPLPKQHTAHYILLIANEEDSTLHLNHVTQHLRIGGCIIIDANQPYDIIRGNLLGFMFKAYDVKELALTPITKFPLFVHIPYQLVPSSIALLLAYEPQYDHALLQNKLQMILTMMKQTEQNMVEDNEQNKMNAIQNTIHYMEQHYYENINVQQLANMAGIVRWQYSELFKQLTGKKPTTYLLHLRIDKAKSLLCDTEHSLQNIAQQVGFKDEYYFSRCFQQVVGKRPRSYANIAIHQEGKKITDFLGRNITIPKSYHRLVTSGTNTVGELFVLGMKPVGSAISTMRKQVIYQNKLQNIIDIGYQAEPLHIQALTPELLLISNYRDNDLRALDSIAPTIIMDPKSRAIDNLRYISHIFEKQEAAEKWINHYEAKMAYIRQQLVGNYQVGETATVYLYSNDMFYIMGQSGFAAILYESLGFQPTPRIAQFIARNELWIKVTKSDLSHYMGDRNFILTNIEDQARLRHLPEVRVLLSNIHQHTHIVDAKWNYEDPITRGALLNILPHIFSNEITLHDIEVDLEV